MPDTTLTIIGNLTDDPQLRTLDDGTKVAHFRVASTPRSFNRTSNDWQDGETLFLGCSVWRQQAEHVASSLRKGDRVIVTGKLQQRSFETAEGKQKTIEVAVDEIGPSLRYATAHITKTPSARDKDEPPAPPSAN
jgi:single-strand DNA-binding protein